MAGKKATERRKRLDEMSSKQLARTVIDGRLVTFHFLSPALEPITGYLCGMDDFHWMVVTTSLDKHLIHKSAARVDLHSSSSYDEEHFRDDLETVVAPFRSFCLREYFGQSESARIERPVPA